MSSGNASIQRSQLAVGIFMEALDEEGRYDAARLGRLLDWTNQDMARYLERDPSTISRHGSSLSYQDPLARLASLFRCMLDLLDDDVRQARAWLRTPIRVLDGVSPKEKILLGELGVVDTLLREIESGFSM